MIDYKILEKDEKLFLAIFDGGFCQYLIPDLEESADPIEDLILGLDEGQFGASDFVAWTPYSAIPQIPNRLFARLMMDGASVIADNRSVNTEAMGQAGAKAFQVRGAA